MGLPTLTGGGYMVMQSLQSSREGMLLRIDRIQKMAVVLNRSSDTAAATLVFGFYRLAQYPEQQQKLYDEIKSVDVHDARALQHCAHLNAIINETLRLHPVLPTGGLRQTPPEGTIIGGRFIPGHTTIIAPRAITSRRKSTRQFILSELYLPGRRFIVESCYEQPNEFVPERWTTRPEMIRDKSTFVPFGLGK